MDRSDERNDERQDDMRRTDDRAGDVLGLGGAAVPKAPGDPSAANDAASRARRRERSAADDADLAGGRDDLDRGAGATGIDMGSGGTGTDTSGS